MMISSKGRYALRVMIDLAENRDSGPIPMKDVAARQDISLKYLEHILPSLVKHHYVEGIHGKGGGYRLTRAPEEYRVSDILRVTEGDLVPVSCLECTDGKCERAAHCRTVSLCNHLNTMINDYLDHVTVADLMEPGRGPGSTAP